MIFALAPLFLASTVAPIDARVDKLVQQQFDKGVVGVTVAVVKNGKVLHNKQYSLAPQTGHHYRLASITKMFTAGVIVKLVREKKLNYETRLGDLMPDVPGEWHSATVRQLLTHTSGIPSYTDMESFDTVATRPATPDQIWKFAANEKVNFAPGKGYSYNNTAYCLLGSIIERTTKLDYYKALDKYILRPAGMRETGPEKQFPPVASFEADGSPSQKLHMDWPYSAGALVSSTGDLIKWDSALRGNKLFTSAEKTLMMNPDPTAQKFNQDYGFAWRTNYADGRVYSHSHTGGIPGFLNIFERTSQGFAFIVLANHAHPASKDIVVGLRKLFDPVDPKGQEAPK